MVSRTHTHPASHTYPHNPPNSLDATRLDPWQAEPDRLHLCIPGVTWRYTCPVLDLVLEFTEYHLQVCSCVFGVVKICICKGHAHSGELWVDDWLIDSELITPLPNPFIQNGVDHIHFAMDFPYGSDDMDVAFETLRPYIDEGKVRTMRCMACCVLRFRRRVGRVDPSYALYRCRSCPRRRCTGRGGSGRTIPRHVHTYTYPDLSDPFPTPRLTYLPYETPTITAVAHQLLPRLHQGAGHVGRRVGPRRVLRPACQGPQHY